jgi:lysophospholipase L1-like esterase
MYALELQAMAYAEYTVNGQTFRIYSPSVAKRSIKNVAINAIIDINDKSVSPEQDMEHGIGYPYLITDSYCNNTGMYSPYTSAQRSVLAEFAGFEEMDYAIMFEKVKEAYNGKYFSILGDSISTFNGISNNASINSTIGNNVALYPWGEVQDSSNTYWGRLISDIGMALCVDNAWSGSHVVGTENWGYKDNMYFRATELDRDSGENPDVIFVFMSTNDLIHTSTFGDLYTILKTNNGKTDDEKIAEWFAGVYAAASASGNTVKPFSTWDAGYALSLDAMKNKYQGAELFCLTLMPNHHSGFTAQKLEEYNTCIKALGNYFGATVVELDQGEIIYDNCSIFTVDGAGDAIHPNFKGYAYMERAIIEAMYKKIANK